MFSDSKITRVSLVDSSKTTKSTKSSSMQTNKMSTHDFSAQSVEKSNQKVQTEAMHRDVEEYVNTDQSQLAAFMRKVEPMFLKTIANNLSSQAFNNYLANMPLGEDVVTRRVTLNQTEPQMMALSLSWNCSGTTIGVAYGSTVHDDWCTHKGYVCTWNIERRNLNPSKPDVSVEMDACATTIKFHPTTPSLVAAGSFTGEVNVYNLAADDSNSMSLAHSRNSQSNHTESISDIQWLNKTSTNGDLATCSYDGKIILWVLPLKATDLTATALFLITIRLLPRSLRGSVSSTGKETGLSALSFVHGEPHLFIAGGETGAVMHCSLNSKDPIASKDESSLPVYNPVVLGLRPHRGPVYSVQTSTFHRNIFLTCGADGTVRVYNMLKLDPLIILSVSSGPVFDANFSPVRPTVFACCTWDGKLVLYDLLLSEKEAVSVFETEGEEELSMRGVSFNNTRLDLLAVARDTGEVTVCELADRLTSMMPTEMHALHAIAMRVTAD